MATDQTSLGSLISSAISDAQTLVRDEIALAKAELKESAKRVAASSGLFIAAIVLLAYAFLLLLFAAVYGIAEGLPLWASFLIVGGALVLIVAGLVTLGVVQAKRIRGPERAIAEVQKTKDALARKTT
jgi:cytochrome c biogenesis protein CcdA